MVDISIVPCTDQKLQARSKFANRHTNKQLTTLKTICANVWSRDIEIVQTKEDFFPNVILTFFSFLSFISLKPGETGLTSSTEGWRMKKNGFVLLLFTSCCFVNNLCAFGVLPSQMAITLLLFKKTHDRKSLRANVWCLFQLQILFWNITFYIEQHFSSKVADVLCMQTLFKTRKSQLKSSWEKALLSSIHLTPFNWKKNYSTFFFSIYIKIFCGTFLNTS